MRRKWIAGTAVVAVVGATAIAASTVIGGDAGSVRPEYAAHELKLNAVSAEQAGLSAKKAKKAKVLYFQGDGTLPFTSAGPYIDLTLTTSPANACRRVVDGGAVAQSTDVYQQGTSVGPGTGEYHVYLGLDDGATVADTPFFSHLICLKGTK
jgi:hypothetical protein